MEIGKTLDVKNRRAWRAWLAGNHATAKEIWLIYPKKATGERRIPYNHAVEEALCYGWIDSTQKTLDAQHTVQRFSPRRKGSVLSPMNKERVRRLIRAGKMTRAGLASIEQHLDRKKGSGQPQTLKAVRYPSDILDAIKANADAWKYFRRFPKSYKQIRVGWIDGARKRPAEFDKRLRYFVKMTAQNKKFGMVQ
jgi:uncharacterized protein YdeI (YjbR/CyaY-like superfamily)